MDLTIYLTKSHEKFTVTTILETPHTKTSPHCFSMSLLRAHVLIIQPRTPRVHTHKTNILLSISTYIYFWNRSFQVVCHVGDSVCSCYLKLSCYKSAFKYLLLKFRLSTTKDLFSCISFITLKLHLRMCCLNFVGNRKKMGEASGFLFKAT